MMKKIAWIFVILMMAIAASAERYWTRESCGGNVSYYYNYINQTNNITYNISNNYTTIYNITNNITINYTTVYNITNNITNNITQEVSNATIWNVVDNLTFQYIVDMSLYVLKSNQVSNLSLFVTNASLELILSNGTYINTFNSTGDILKATNDIYVNQTGDTMTGMLNLTKGLNVTGGLIVETGNVGIGTTTPQTPLSVLQPSGGVYPTLGTASGGMSLTYTPGLWGTYIGEVAADGNVWIQQMRNDGATAYNIILQPVGGNVGIGTTSPGANLEIKKSGAGAPATSGTAQTGVLRLSNGYNNDVLDFGSYATATGPMWIQSVDSSNLALNKDLVFQPNGGNVGIGTTSPLAWLDIKGASSQPHLSLTTTRGFATSRNWGFNINWNAEGDFHIMESPNRTEAPNTSRMSILSGGNIGIGNNGASDTKLTITGATTDNTKYILVGKNSGTLNMFWMRNDGVSYFYGNVGIGTTSPTHKLEVTGSINTSMINATNGFLSNSRICTAANGACTVNTTLNNYISALNLSRLMRDINDIGIINATAYKKGAADVNSTQEIWDKKILNGTIPMSTSVSDVWVNITGDVMTGTLSMTNRTLIHPNGSIIFMPSSNVSMWNDTEGSWKYYIQNWASVGNCVDENWATYGYNNQPGSEHGYFYENMSILAGIVGANWTFLMYDSYGVEDLNTVDRIFFWNSSNEWEAFEISGWVNSETVPFTVVVPANGLTGTLLRIRTDSYYLFGTQSDRYHEGGVKWIYNSTPRSQITVQDIYADNITAKYVRVTDSLYIGGGNHTPDYVFDKSYKLQSLSEREAFIIENKHLPNMPSAKEVEQNGLDVANYTQGLHTEVEELWLYIFQLEDRINQLEGGQ
jgi:hypothetical protein